MSANRRLVRTLFFFISLLFWVFSWAQTEATSRYLDLDQNRNIPSRIHDSGNLKEIEKKIQNLLVFLVPAENENVLVYQAKKQSPYESGILQGQIDTIKVYALESQTELVKHLRENYEEL